MPRTGALALLGTVAVGLVALLVVGVTDERRTAFTLGVAPTGVAAELGPGQRACQVPVRVAESFTHVAFRVGTFKREGQPLDVSVSKPGGTARGRLEGGYGDGLEHAVPVGTVNAGAPVDVCIQNRGRRKVAIYGGAGAAARLTTARIEGTEADVDLSLVFKREARSGLSTLPDVLQHASRFRPGWVGPWLFWLLGALLLLGAPLALALALRTAAEGDELL